jgi:dTDP-glucose 4,6-dehydratase
MEKNKYFEEDLINMANSINIDMFDNSTIFITGITGLIGFLLTRAILKCNEVRKSTIKVIGLARNKEKAETMFKEYESNKNLKFVYTDIVNKIKVKDNFDYIIHCASMTQSKFFISNPVDTINIAVNGTFNVLNLAKEKNVKKMIYVSSMEVYGFVSNNEKNMSEEELGFIDPLNIRSCYSEGKRMAECLCSSFSFQYNIDICIARLAQTFGAGINKSENRVFAQFAKSAINNKDIVLKTKGESFGNYCYTSDVIKGLFTILEKGNSPNAYNVVNEESTMQIKDMAKMVADKISQKNINLIFDISDNSCYAPDTKLRLSSHKLNSLGWSAEVSLQESYKRMISWMKAF